VKTRVQLPKKDMHRLIHTPELLPMHGPESHSPNQMSSLTMQRSFLQLQRSVGNQVVMRLLDPKAADHNAAPLTVNEPSDRFEREADAVADQVMRAPSTQAGGSQNSLSVGDDVNKLQRRCSHCEEEEKNFIARSRPFRRGQ
jgi:hypothetical protein